MTKHQDDFDMSNPRTFADPDKNTSVKYTYAITFSHDSKLSIWFKPNNPKAKFVRFDDTYQIIPTPTDFKSIETIRDSQDYGCIALFVESNTNYSVPDAPYDYTGSSWINYHFTEVLNNYQKRQVSVVELLKLELRVQKLERNKLR